MTIQPFVSIIIPVTDIGYYIIFENLPALSRQTYRHFEVLILPNEHSQYDLELMKKYKWLRIIPTGKITRPAQKRDMGVNEARGEIIAFIDDDAFPMPEWLMRAVYVFRTKSVAAVCGPGILPKNAEYWEQVFDEVLKSRMGSGGYSYRFTPGKNRYVDDYPSMNFFIKKNVFEKLGGFNSDYWPGEDSKLCNDLIYKMKGKIYYDQSVVIYHHRRKELGSFIKQHRNYGFHRGAFFAHGDRNSKQLTYIIPAGFVAYLTGLCGVFVLHFILHLNLLLLLLISIPLFLYIVGLSVLFFTAFTNSRRFSIALAAPLVLFLTHLNYGIMFVQGYVKGLHTSRSIYD